MRELTLEAAVEHIPELTQIVDAELEKAGCPPCAQTQIDVAVDELFSNIAAYAYGESGGSVTVQIRVDRAGRAAELTFMDGGVPYNPLKQKDPDVFLAIENRNLGGFGIFIVKKSMDQVRYEYKDGQNCLTVRKEW